MAGHIIDKENTRHTLGKINSLLAQSLNIIRDVNKDEQWDFCTDAKLSEEVATSERLIKSISDIVFQTK